MGALPNYRKTPRKNISCISESLARLRWTFGRPVEDLRTDQMAYYPPTRHSIRADKERDLFYLIQPLGLWPKSQLRASS